jgi:hypothetical protein
MVWTPLCNVLIGNYRSPAGDVLIIPIQASYAIFLEAVFILLSFLEAPFVIFPSFLEVP